MGEKDRIEGFEVDAVCGESFEIIVEGNIKLLNKKNNNYCMKKTNVL